MLTRPTDSPWNEVEAHVIFWSCLPTSKSTDVCIYSCRQRWWAENTWEFYSVTDTTILRRNLLKPRPSLCNFSIFYYEKLLRHKYVQWLPLLLERIEWYTPFYVELLHSFVSSLARLCSNVAECPSKFPRTPNCLRWAIWLCYLVNIVKWIFMNFLLSSVL